ncbi:hypothetical protein QL285_061143 [Trifolium repens]|nr:hypothetical protein QL285_061143 [Trifolium repens]
MDEKDDTTSTVVALIWCLRAKQTLKGISETSIQPFFEFLRFDKNILGLIYGLDITIAQQTFKICGLLENIVLIQ